MIARPTRIVRPADAPKRRHSLQMPILAACCAVMFFVGLGRFEFIKTEALRATVAKEMMDRPALSMPTIHDAPYLKKPPLYAWIVTLMARGMGRLDEWVARLPSAVLGTLLVLLVYRLGKAYLPKGGGLAAASFVFCTVTVADYSTRAELDIGFAYFTTLALALAFVALHRGGRGASLPWLGCYAAAALGAFWKAPHSLIFLWVTIAVYTWRTGRLRLLLHPAQLLGAAGMAALLVGWTVMLSQYAGPSTVARAAGIELLSRLVPYKPEHLLTTLSAIPMMLAIMLPGSAFVMAGFRAGPIHDADEAFPRGSIVNGWRLCRHRFARWWDGLSRNAFVEFVGYWAVANALWCAIVPAKSPRYWLALFPAFALLGAYTLTTRASGPMATGRKRVLHSTWRLIFVAMAIVGGAAMIVGVAVLVVPGWVAGYHLAPAWPWLVLGVAWIVPAIWTWRRNYAHLGALPCWMLIAAALATKPLLLNVWWPARVAAETGRAVATQIDQIVAPHDTVYVLGSPLAEPAFYSKRSFIGVHAAAEAFAQSPAASHAFLLLCRERDDFFPSDAPITSDSFDVSGQTAGVGVQVVELCEHAENPLCLLRVTEQVARQVSASSTDAKHR